MTKKDIIQRLFEAEHISFNEMWILLQDEPEVRYIPMPQVEPVINHPVYIPPISEPYVPDIPQWPPGVTCKDVLKDKFE